MEALKCTGKLFANEGGTGRFCAVGASDQWRRLSRALVMIIFLALRLTVYSLFVLLLFGDQQVELKFHNIVTTFFKVFK